MIAVDGTGDRGLTLMMEDSTTADWPAILGDERFGSYSWIVRDAATPATISRATRPRAFRGTGSECSSWAFHGRCLHERPVPVPLKTR